MCGMDRTELHKFEQPLFEYRQVEAALAGVFGADRKHQHGALRGRLKNLQRLGLGSGTGKGARNRYSRAQIYQWLLCLTLMESGIDPSIIIPTVKANWKTLAPEAMQAADTKALTTGSSAWIVLWKRLMSHTWREEPTGLRIQIIRLSPSAPPSFGGYSPDAPRPPHELVELAFSAGTRGQSIEFINFSTFAIHLEHLLRL
jgi:hypothetical protein